MADSKVSALPNYTTPIPTDVLPIVDVTNSLSKKVAMGILATYVAGTSTVIYVMTTGNDSNNGLSWMTPKLTVAAAIAALPANGGTIQLGYGTFNVSSTGRTDTVTATAGSTTINDTSCVAGDVGSYVVGAAIQGRTPQILTVNPGVSFTVDVAPQGSGTSLFVFKPAFVHPENVKIVGMGGSYTTNGFGQGNAAATKILDGGTGITSLVRGGSPSTGNTNSRYTLQDLAIWSNNRSAYTGVFISNMAWFYNATRCDFGYYYVGGVVLDGNMNSDSFYDCQFLGNGTSSSTGITGGVITSMYWSQPSSSVNFWNCFFNQNYGWGINNGTGGGSFGVNLYGPQFNNTIASAATGSGVGLALQSHGNADGIAAVYGGWCESSASYDVVTTGYVALYSFSMGSSATSHVYINGGTLTAVGCVFENYSGASLVIANGGNVNWMGCFLNDSYFYSGCPANGAIAGMGTTGSFTSQGSFDGGMTINTGSVSLSATTSRLNQVMNVTAAATVTLPVINTPGVEFLIKNPSAYAITVDAGSGYTIDGTRTYVLPASTANKYVRVVSTYTNGVWYVAGNN